MLNLILNILGFFLFIAFLAGVFFVSFYVAIVLLGIFIFAFIGLKLWAYLVEKKIVNPRPGHPMGEDVIDVEFTRVETKIEKRD